MANLQVKNVPDTLHNKLRRLARRQGRSLRDLVLEALQREVARDDFERQLARRAPVDLGRAAGKSLERARSQRKRDLGG